MAKKENYRYSSVELMIASIAREIRDKETIAVGTLSPIPAAACYLAQASHAPSATYLITGQPDWPLEGEYAEVFDLAQRRELDLFFLSGIEIDSHANINLCVIGSHARPDVRLPGGAGAAMLYYMSRRTILFVPKHEKRVFPSSVQFITAPGSTPELKARLGGPTKVVTPLCVFVYSLSKGCLEIDSIHPGVSTKQVEDSTGFKVAFHDKPSETEKPSKEELKIIRSLVRRRLSKVYPEFSQTNLGS